MVPEAELSTFFPPQGILEIMFLLNLQHPGRGVRSLSLIGSKTTGDAPFIFSVALHIRGIKITNTC